MRCDEPLARLDVCTTHSNSRKCYLSRGSAASCSCAAGSASRAGEGSALLRSGDGDGVGVLV